MKRDLELLLDERINRIFQNFSDSFGVTILFCTPDGEIRRRRRMNAPYCELIQQAVCSRADCEANDRTARNCCLARGRLYPYRCHAGVEEAIAPIRAGEELLGFSMFGQFRTAPEPPESVLRRCPPERRGELLRTYRSLPEFTPERLEPVLGLFEMLVDYIIDHELIVKKDSVSVRELERWLRRHCAEPLTVADAARQLHCSPSTATHQLRRKLGMSFQELLIELRLARAEQLMTAAPGLSVKEAAAAVGYADAGYFSRLYHKKRGMTPGHFRRHAETIGESVLENHMH